MPETRAQGPPLIRTKLLPPVARDVIERPAAVALLCDGRPRRLTLVRAPAGWGKSSLAAAWASEDERAFAWVALDKLDSSPVRFFSYTIAALQGLAAPVGERSGPILLAGGELVDEVLPVLLDELDALPGPAVLVLDDLHLVESREVYEALAFLVEHAPPELELALLSRTEPPLPLARLRGRGELLEVTAEHLRFDREEATRLLNDREQLRLAPDDVRRLVDRTEGWPAGLYLAALSLAGRADAADAVARFAGDDRHVVDYLTDEVLAGQPPDVREFLLSTCMLERLSPELCDTVTGRDDGEARLRQIEASNLFLVPLDHQRAWYRYHHLFADLLRHEARGRDVREAHARAARWHLAHGAIGDAVRHHVAAGDVAAAGDAIAEHWMGALTTGEHDAVAAWLDALPAEAIRDDARLGAARVMVGIGTGRVADLDGWIEAMATARPGGPAFDGFASPAAGAACLRSVHRWLIGDLRASLSAAEASLRDGGPGAPWDAVSLTMLAGARTWLGDLEGGRVATGRALARARAVGFHPPIISCLGMVAMDRLEAGDHEAARLCALEAIELTGRHGLAEAWTSAGSHTTLGVVLRAEGRAEAARAELERGLELARRGSGVFGVAHALLALAPALAAIDARALVAEARWLLDGCPDPGPVATAYLAAAERGAGATLRPSARLDEPFSDRELQVLRMLSGPLSQREIGLELYISFNTVKSHTKAIYRKLGANDRTGALERARELGVL